MSGTEVTQTEEKQPRPLRNGGHTHRGGRRPGAGRKPDYLKRLGIKALTAAEILAHHNEPELWQGLLHNKSADIRLRTLAYLTDRRDGKARQAVNVTGAIAHAHTVYRDPLLAALTDEELRALDGITKKLALPAQDGPDNQKESNTATLEGEVANTTIEAAETRQEAANCETENAAIEAEAAG